MKLLIAGPGTGKTTRVKNIIDEDYPDARNVLVLSFTNATVNDLRNSFLDYRNVTCYTLHSYALKIRHQRNLYILDGIKEAPLLEKLASDLELDFPFLCSQLECITFDAMIFGCLQFIKTNTVYSKEQIGELDLLIVDEYQDFNQVERELVAEISKHANDTIILGDDDQSIYGFKDADPDGIIDLFKSEDIEYLNHDNICYRCPDVIVQSAFKLISNNTHRIAKQWNPSGKEGDLSQNQFLTQLEANQFIVSEIQKNQREDTSYSYLVLSAVRYYVDQLVELLDIEGIDCVDFWDTDLENDEYYKVWWLRFIYSRRKLLNLIFLAETLTVHFRRKLKAYLYSAFREGIDHSEMINEISAFYKHDFIEFYPEHPQLSEFQNSYPEYSDLIGSLDIENLDSSLDSLIKDQNPQKEFNSKSVNIMSIHKSKGLQADIVFINGLVDGVIPNEARGLDTIEAQRRLLFVGLTRACHRLYLISPIEWDGKYVHRLDKDQFNFDYRSKSYRAQSSRFIGEFI